MEELVRQVTQKTGISDQQAKGAVDTVVGYLKGKLPGPVAGQIDGVLAGGKPGGGASGMPGGLGDVLGRK